MVARAFHMHLISVAFIAVLVHFSRETEVMTYFFGGVSINWQVRGKVQRRECGQKECISSQRHGVILQDHFGKRCKIHSLDVLWPRRMQVGIAEGLSSVGI